jgi:hypothetical protein
MNTEVKHPFFTGKRRTLPCVENKRDSILSSVSHALYRAIEETFFANKQLKELREFDTMREKLDIQYLPFVKQIKFYLIHIQTTTDDNRERGITMAKSDADLSLLRAVNELDYIIGEETLAISEDIYNEFCRLKKVLDIHCLSFEHQIRVLLHLEDILLPKPKPSTALIETTG